MAENIMNNNEIAILLIKEYEAMRTELRDYIKRYYSSIVIVQSIIFATIFTAAKENLAWLYLFIPGLMMGFAALMSLITLFIGHQASYLKLIEQRLNNLCGREYFIWETEYADQSLRRDRGILFSPIISIIYIFIVIPLVLATIIRVNNGYTYINNSHPDWHTWFTVYASVSFLSIFLFPITNKIIRNKCKKFNEELIKKES